jgi:hypothetical protein
VGVLVAAGDTRALYAIHSEMLLSDICIYQTFVNELIKEK